MSDSQQVIFTEIWNKYHSEMCRYCYGNLHGYNEEAEDIVERAFYLLWKKMTEDSLPPVPNAWLYKTIENLIKAEYRRQKKVQKYLDFGSDTCASLQYIVDYDEEMAEQELHEELIKAANEELDNEEWKFIKYLFIEEKSHKEIAEIMGTTEDAVKQRRYRLMRKTHGISKRKKKKLGFI